MKPFYRICTAMLLLVLLCSTQVCAQEGAATLDERMEQFRAEYGLTEQNFSLCYYDTVSGEEYRFNDKKFMVAASTFKLPLNLYYYEMEQSGGISPDAYIGGMSLSQAHYQSLVWSNNDVSIAMLYNLGNFRTYKDKMRTYFTMDDSEITSEYYADNNYCTAMMLDALKYLYQRQDQFGEMIGYLKEAQPGQYFDRYIEDYKVAHKYGFFVDDDKGVTAVNDVGIVYTPQPFLLAVYTSNANAGEEVVARACELLTAYNVEQYGLKQAAAEPAPTEDWEGEPPADAPEALESPPALPAETVPEPEPAKAEPEAESDKPADPSLWWIILTTAVVLLAVDLAVLFRLRKHFAAEDEIYANGAEKTEKPCTAPDKAQIILDTSRFI